MKTLGPARRFSVDFQLISIVNLLYVPRVRSHLEYAREVWGRRTRDTILL